MAGSPPPKRQELQVEVKDDWGIATDHTRETITDVSAFMSRFSALYNNPHLSDVVLRVNSVRYHAHRFVLATASEVFEAMLNQSRWAESKEPEVELTEDSECVAMFGPFLRYLYSGCIELSTDSVLAVLLLADKYSISALQASCIQYMLRHIVEWPDANRTLTWHQYAKMADQHDLKEGCSSFILSNFDVILDAPDWTEMTKVELVEFLHSSELIVKSEIHLWNSLEKWLTCDYNKDCIEENLKDILPLLRFTMILPKNLLAIEASQLCSKYHEIFAEKVNFAYKQHSLRIDCGDIGMTGHREQFRNYYDDDYGLYFPFKLEKYQCIDKIHSRIMLDCHVPSFYMPVLRQCSQSLTNFTVYFYPRGYFTTITLYGTYINRQNDDTMLKVCRKFSDHEAMKVDVSLVLYSTKNGVRYVAYTCNASHVFGKAKSDLKVSSVIDQVKLMQECSPYLDMDTLDGSLFIKVQDIGPHLLNADPQ